MGTPKTLQQAAENLKQAAPLIGTRYAASIQRADWQGPASTDQAEQNYATSVQRAIAARRRQTKIRALSNRDWQQASIDKGAPIIGERVSQAIPKWQAAFGPIYDQVLAALPQLPQRGVDFRQNIATRLVPVVETFKRAAGKL